MKRSALFALAIAAFAGSAAAQDIKTKDVPAVVKEALAKNIPMQPK